MQAAIGLTVSIPTPPLLHFRTVGSVLRWAYASDSDVRDVLERHLDPRAIQFLRAKYAHDYEHLTLLRNWVIAGLPTGLHKGRGVEKMILCYLGHKIGPKSLQRDLRCTTAAPLSLTEVSHYQHITGERMDALQEQVETTLGSVMRERGLL
jgi:hypothetical protein